MYLAGRLYTNNNDNNNTNNINNNININTGIYRGKPQSLESAYHEGPFFHNIYCKIVPK